MKVRLGDEVLVTKGKDRGKKGKVEKVLLEKNKVLIFDVNVAKKHQKPAGEKKPGGIIDLPKPIPVTNVKLVCPKCNQPTRVGYRIEKDGKKYRQCKKCSQLVGKD